MRSLSIRQYRYTKYDILFETTKRLYLEHICQSEIFIQYNIYLSFLGCKLGEFLP